MNPNMLMAGATFVAEVQTATVYRLWSIHDKHPGMLRVNQGGAAIWLELWEVPPAGVIQIMDREPPGLSLGRVALLDGRDVLGVLVEPYLVEGQRDITSSGGWRAYLAHSA